MAGGNSLRKLQCGFRDCYGVFANISAKATALSILPRSRERERVAVGRVMVVG